MKKTALIFLLSFLYNFLHAQDKTGAKKLVEEGIEFHDKGDYNQAISFYNKALELDTDNLLALTEKAYSLLSLNKYDEAIKYCQKILELYPNDEDLLSVYVTFGNAYDGLKMTDKSLAVYDEGIKRFAGHYLLFFNKGITLVQASKIEEAEVCFQNAAMKNPNHASSHNAVARLAIMNNTKIPAILAVCRFLTLEQLSPRAIENKKSLIRLMKGNAEVTGKNETTITLSQDQLDDASAKGSQKKDNFASTEFLLSMSAALDNDRKNRKLSEVEQFIRNFETVCASLKENKENNDGFFWEYYAPYFIEMKEKNLLEPFAYIVFASSDNEKVTKWLIDHRTETRSFHEWSTKYEWKTN